jgi:uncharacterized membrane protein YfcA
MEHTLPIAGFVLGLCVGLTSMGGGSLMAPFLILIVGVRPVVAVGTDLAYGAITKLFGAAVHWHEDTVDFGAVKTLAIGSVPGGILAALAVPVLSARGFDMDAILRHAIGIVLVFVAVLLLLRLVFVDRFRQPRVWFPRLHRAATSVFGAIAGVAVGLTSIGSGSLITPFLMMMYPMSAARVVGTDLFHAAILVSVTAIVHAGSGSVDWIVMSRLLVGSVPGVVLGSWLAPRLPAPVLRLGLVSVLLTSGLKLM